MFDHVMGPVPETVKQQHKTAFFNDVTSSRIELKGGHVIIQSLEHYFSHIHVVDCYIDREDYLKIVIPKSTAFFEVLNGTGIKIYREGKLMDGYSEPVCSLVNYSAGKYGLQLSKGHHLIVLANVNLLWLSGIVEKYPLFSNLLMANTDNVYLRLQECPFSAEIRKTVNKFLYGGKEKLSDNEPKLLRVMNRLISQFHDQCTSDHPAVGLNLQNESKRLVAFLEANYADPKIDGVMVAKALFMSPKSLQRLAKTIFGVGLREQIIKYRMTYAVKFLSVDKKNVKEVARLTGYTSPAYFSRAFSKFWKTSPSELLNR